MAEYPRLLLLLTTSPSELFLLFGGRLLDVLLGKACVDDGSTGEKEDAHPNLKLHSKNMIDERTIDFDDMLVLELNITWGLGAVGSVPCFFRFGRKSSSLAAIRTYTYDLLACKRGTKTGQDFDFPADRRFSKS